MVIWKQYTSTAKLAWEYIQLDNKKNEGVEIPNLAVSMLTVSISPE